MHNRDASLIYSKCKENPHASCHFLWVDCFTSTFCICIIPTTSIWEPKLSFSRLVCIWYQFFFFFKWGVIFNDKEISNFIHGQVFFVRQTNTNNVILKNHSTHRCACKIFLVTLCALPHSVGPAVFRRLLVRSPAALCLSVACALLDYVEQMKCVFMLSFRGLGLAPLVAVLTGGMMPPAELYSGA